MQDGSFTLNMILDQVSRDKGIDKEILVEAIETAILTAAKRSFGQDRDLEARFNEETGVVDLFQYMKVVDITDIKGREISLEMIKKNKLTANMGEELGFQIFYRDDDAQKAKKQDKEFSEILDLKTHGRGFGRIAAQTAKQVIIQKVRDAERENIYNEYKDRKSEVIAGIIRRFERNNDIIVDLGRAEGVIPGREQIPRESYRPGDRVMAYVKDIDREARSQQIILSRTDVGLLKKLFEMEVPEMYEGIVKIMAAAREPGIRSKIAVTSRDLDVDPVGACVGMRGSRVQAVVQELRGEKIDIVPWERDPARFVCNAIQPAEVSRVIIDEANGSMELVVPDDKLSLAIGRRGQNVRLASQITGWTLDVISETNFREHEQEAIESLAMIEGVDESIARSMYKLGFRTVEEIVEADPSELAAIPGLGSIEHVGDIQQAAENAMEKLRLIHLRELASREAPITQRERMLFVRGIGQRTIEIMAEAGYHTLEDLFSGTENSEDKLAVTTGMGIKKARQILQAAEQFLKSETQVLAQLKEEALIEREKADVLEQAALEQKEREDAQANAEKGDSKGVDQEEIPADLENETLDPSDETGDSSEPSETNPAKQEEGSIDMNEVDDDW